MATDPYTIAPLSPPTWPAFDALVQRHNGIFGGCWCIWFHPDSPERGQDAETNRALKKRQTRKMSSSFLYNGTRRLYERLGFTYDRPKGLKNCVMVKTVEPA
ncbi:hypothetical protein [Actinoplanes friuliensis]|uniref:GCN5-related N-acetyltransferase n=1 Tax=Actinoplanes friuliensis DSM 7358 TaxID=1246995 RepID=U5W324_9ACTN|nr:hypothetical protein [Actinoplanes friuliensis]AGZ42395.1 GCN5-related N-acetyltransferase [Actinoplanes friuliensis DSM 7358]